MPPSARIPIVLCFSGHDPTGGAGIAADIEAIRAQGAHPATIVTALTVQDSRNVCAVTAIDSAEIVAQAELVLEDLPVAAFKIGMLGSDDNARAVASVLREHANLPVVLDPVLRAGGGAALADPPLIDAMARELLPQATLITPNVAEAQYLAAPAREPAECAAMLLNAGAGAVLITGGDLPGNEVVNTLYQANAQRSWRWPKLPHRYHGSGCTLASAIAARLALGETLADACEQAQRYAWNSLDAALVLGRGQRFPRRLA
jgi:hydroxymethylpyrimidine/phosphomethylpyrimidine kinase